MPKSERLLLLLDLFRQCKRAITAEAIGKKLDISTRTVYRDIEALRYQGADIRGEVGIGFVLYKDFFLPPLMFNEKEIEALVFGIRWVMQQHDPELSEQAQSVLSKINTVLPSSIAELLPNTALYPFICKALPHREDEIQSLIVIRRAIRESRKLIFAYTDKQGLMSKRTVLPIAVGYFEGARLLITWCELREDYRNFRPDRIHDLQLGDANTGNRQRLLKEWQRREDITLQQFEF